MLSFGRGKDQEIHPLTQVALSEPIRLRVGVAFASEAGVRALSKLLPVEDDGLEKQWLVGIENGMTQPESLAYLSQLPSSEVRVPYGHKTLASAGLRAPVFFHSKIFVVESATGISIGSGSGNLTEGGLLENIEQFAHWAGAHDEPDAIGFEEWWQRLWRRSDAVDDGFVASYKDARPSVRPPADLGRPSEGPVHEEEPAPTDLKRAEWLWIELHNPPWGESRNQFELMLTAHHFFHPEEEPSRAVKKQLVFEDEKGNAYENQNRVIHYNGPPLMKKGNAMWRIRLPTEHEGLEGYQGGGVVIRFARTETRDRYRIEIAGLESATASSWEGESRKVASVEGPPLRRMGWA